MNCSTKHKIAFHDICIKSYRDPRRSNQREPSSASFQNVRRQLFFRCTASCNRPVGELWFSGESVEFQAVLVKIYTNQCWYINIQESHRWNYATSFRILLHQRPWDFDVSNLRSSSSPVCKQSGLQLQYASYSCLPFVSPVGWGANARDGKWIVGTNCICLVGYLLLRPPWFIIYPASDHQCCCFGAALLHTLRHRGSKQVLRSGAMSFI